MAGRHMVKAYLNGNKYNAERGKNKIIIDKDTQEIFDGLTKICGISLETILNKLKYVIKEEILSFKMTSFGAIYISTRGGKNYVMTLMDADEDSLDGTPQVCVFLDGTAKMSYLSFNKENPVREVNETIDKYVLKTYCDDTPGNNPDPDEPATFEHLRITTDEEENLDIRFDGFDVDNHDKIADSIDGYEECDSIADIVKWLIKALGRTPRIISIILSNNFYGDEYEEIIEITDCKISSYSIYNNEDDYGNNVSASVSDKGDYFYEIGTFRMEHMNGSNITRIIPGRKKCPFSPEELNARKRITIQDLRTRMADFNKAFENNKNI